MCLDCQELQQRQKGSRSPIVRGIRGGKSTCGGESSELGPARRHRMAAHSSSRKRGLFPQKKGVGPAINSVKQIILRYISPVDQSRCGTGRKYIGSQLGCRHSDTGGKAGKRFFLEKLFFPADRCAIQYFEIHFSILRYISPTSSVERDGIK